LGLRLGDVWGSPSHPVNIGFNAAISSATKEKKAETAGVLEYMDMPGAKTQEHHYPAFFLHALEPFKRKITLPGGKTIMREFKTGDVMWPEAQTHTGENAGTMPTHVLMIEMK
jgi:beta-alanine degradation protein BauB